MFLGIDYGKKRIGLALGSVIPKGAGTIDGSKSRDSIIFDIKELCEENDVDKIVVGFPLKPSGDEGDTVPEIQNFAEDLTEATKIPVFFEEEELTSVEAEKILSEANMERGKESGKIDEMAAVLILEQYINHLDESNKEV